MKAIAVPRFGRAAIACKRGHPLRGANVYRPPGTQKRECRACRALHDRAAKRRRRGVA